MITMTELITNAMVRKQLAEMTAEARRGVTTITSSSANNNPVNLGDISSNISLTEKKIAKVQGDVMIAQDGTKAKLFNPIPGLSWTCRGVANGEGLIVLQTEITGLFITCNDETYCLGVNGETDEFEIKLHINPNTIQVNKDFIHIAYNHMIEQGVERQ